MKQATLRLVTPYSKNQDSEGRDQIGFWLSVLTLCLLPIERMALPFNLKPVDSALVLLTAYGLGKAWRTRQRLGFPLLLPMWLILISSLVATLVGFALPRSIIAIVQEVYLFAWFIVLTNILKTFSRSDLDRLMKVWSVIACAEALTTLMGMLRIGPRMFYASFFYADPNRERAIISSAGFSRAVGTFVNPNATAAYLSISFFVLLATSWPIWLRLVLGMWILAGMFGTGSMGALFSTLGSLVILLPVDSIVRNRQVTTLWGAIVGIGTGVLAAMLFILSLWPSLVSGVGLDTSGRLFALTLGRFPRSMTSRLGRIDRSWSIYSRHPWGTGPSAYASLGLSAHNDYVAFLFERGPVGAIGWLWMVGAALLAPLRAAYQRTDRHQRWQVLALWAGFLACAMNAFTHEVSHFRQVWVLMAFLFAMSYARSAPPMTGSPASTESANRRKLA